MRVEAKAHRAGFRSYWRWKSGARGERPQIDSDLRALIQKVSSSALFRRFRGGHIPIPGGADNDVQIDQKMVSAKTGVDLWP
jgi:hypothetical protein